MMANTCIWSPVVVASLAVPHSCQQEYRYKSDQIIKCIEDVKVKIKNPQAQRQGKVVEARMKLEIITLLEDYQGCTQVINRQETIKERVPLTDFDSQPDQEGESTYIVQITNLKWDAEMERNELSVSCSIQYLLLATRDQIVTLNRNEKPEDSQEEPENELLDLKMEIDRMRQDNHVLAHKLFLYERDLVSLQRGIRKVENRNAALSKELGGYQEMVEKLRVAITRKDLIISNYENPRPETSARVLAFPSRDDVNNNLGQKIKRMFLNSL